MTGEELSDTDLLLAAPVQQSAVHTGDGPDLDLSYRRENEWLHHDPMLEREMFRFMLNDIPAVDRALTAALCDFADRVRDNRRSKHSRMSALSD